MRDHRAIVVLLAAVLLIAPATALVAQDNCQAFKAIAQGTLIFERDSLPPALADFWDTYPEAWGGQVYAAYGSIGANAPRPSFATGWFYGTDSTAPPPNPNNGNGRGRDGFYLFAFGTHDGDGWHITDSFTIQLGQAVWTPNPSGMGNFGTYQAAGTLTEGTGVFEGATGNFTFQGDFAYNFSSPPYFAAWNPNLVGKVCK